MQFEVVSTIILWLVMQIGAGQLDRPIEPLFDDSECIATIFYAPPDYYTIDLVTTRRVPGSAQAEGIGKVSYMTSPFGISLASDGSYRYRLDIKVNKLLPPRKGHYVVWVTTPDLDQVVRVGVLPDNHTIRGIVEWNKFLVVITLEPDEAGDAEIWSGPIVLRGVSRSGLMHTMAGHGPFEDEPCALYGY